MEFEAGNGLRLLKLPSFSKRITALFQTISTINLMIVFHQQPVHFEPDRAVEICSNIKHRHLTRLSRLTPEGPDQPFQQFRRSKSRFNLLKALFLRFITPQVINKLHNIGQSYSYKET